MKFIYILVVFLALTYGSPIGDDISKSDKKETDKVPPKSTRASATSTNTAELTPGGTLSSSAVTSVSNDDDKKKMPEKEEKMSDKPVEDKKPMDDKDKKPMDDKDKKPMDKIPSGGKKVAMQHSKAELKGKGTAAAKGDATATGDDVSAIQVSEAIGGEGSVVVSSGSASVSEKREVKMEECMMTETKFKKMLFGALELSMTEFLHKHNSKRDIVQASKSKATGAAMSMGEVTVDDSDDSPAEDTKSESSEAPKKPSMIMQASDATGGTKAVAAGKVTVNKGGSSKKPKPNIAQLSSSEGETAMSAGKVTVGKARRDISESDKKAEKPKPEVTPKDKSEADKPKDKVKRHEDHCVSKLDTKQREVFKQHLLKSLEMAFKDSFEM